MRKRKLMSSLLTLSLVVLSTPAFGQKQETERKMEVERQAVTAAQGGGGVYTFSGSVGGGFAFAPADGQVATVGYAFSVGDTLVKGQPFSAQAVSESIQLLSDGNRIVRKSTTMMYRDNEGRTRREQTIKAVGPIAVEGNDAKMIYINDPVAGVNFTLDERNKTARKYVIPTTAQGKKAYAEGYAAGSSYAYSTGVGQGSAVTVTQADVEKKVVLEAKMKEAEKAKEKAVESGQLVVSGNGVAVATMAPQQGGAYTEAVKQKYPRKEESLGKQTMEGVEVEGVRYTTTIPAGEIGNEMPINMVTEKWTSDELKQVVFLKTSDPRFGETIYRLTSIVRENPDRSLFDVPADYTIREFKPAVVTGTTMPPKAIEEQKKKTAKPQQ